MTTVFTYAPAPGHTQRFHPENRQRLSALLPALEQAGILGQIDHCPAEPATEEQILRIHSPELVALVRQMSRGSGGLLDGGDTYATAETYDDALQAAGAACTIVDQVMTGRARNGFALIRPPGHHAGVGTSEGFCIFNNVAVAARHAQAHYGAQRVAIVDYDVHHGNGTQDIFYDDPSVHFTSAHLFAPHFYPGSGAANEIGRGEGLGYTLNIPLPSGAGDGDYQLAFERLVVPSLERFRPELILVSVGFDAHWLDPLATASLSLTGYTTLARLLIAAADRLCDGRIAFVLEGGYQLEVLTCGIMNVFYALLGQSLIYDPIGPAPYAEPSILPLLDRLSQLHLPN